MPYIVCEHDYSIGRSRVIAMHLTHTNAHMQVEDIMHNIQYAHQGTKEYLISKDYNDISSLKYGMFVHDSLGGRYTVYIRNRLEGYVYNSYVDERVVDLFIVEAAVECQGPQDSVFCLNSICCPRPPQFDCHQQFGQVLDQLKTLVKIVDVQPQA